MNPVNMNPVSTNPVYSLVVPIYNEEAALPILLRRLDGLLDQLDGPGEAILVDDGSRDASGIVCEARARADKRYRYIRLSRNFGHQIAITTGMDRARGAGGDRDGRRPAGPARSRAGDGRQMAGGLRHRLRRAPVAAPARAASSG